MMTLPQAIETLGSGGKWPDLTEAIGVAVSSPRSVALDLVLGLKHGGVVAEQAAFALYRMTGRPLPEDRSALITDVLRWVDVIIATGEADRSNASPRVVGSGAPNTSSRDRRPVDTAQRERLTEFLIEELTRTERLVLILFYYEECSYEKIAEVLEMATSAVRKMHEDLLDRIRAEFAPDALPLSRLFQYLVV